MRDHGDAANNRHHWDTGNHQLFVCWPSISWTYYHINSHYISLYRIMLYCIILYKIVYHWEKLGKKQKNILSMIINALWLSHTLKLISYYIISWGSATYLRYRDISKHVGSPDDQCNSMVTNSANSIKISRLNGCWSKKK